MEDHFKEIEEQCRKSLEMWSDMFTQSNNMGWGAHLNFTKDDIMNALNIMVSICTNTAIKNGKIKTADDAATIGDHIRSLMLEDFGIDTTITDETK